MKFISISQARKETNLSYLGGVNLSAKMVKNMKVSNNLTYGLYLSPANTSGYNVCQFATPECKLGCLATSGRAAMDIQSGQNIILNARINKTKLFFEEQKFFMNWMVAEIKASQTKAINNNYEFSVRLNLTSDIDWQNVRLNGQNIFEMFPDVNFYDYSKNFNKFQSKPENYHLTFSYTGKNWNQCKSLLEKGFNIAMVFNVKNETQLPAMYEGYKVVNGDATDLRIKDGKGVIVGLKWKRIANKEAEKQVLNSCFVVKP